MKERNRIWVFRLLLIVFVIVLLELIGYAAMRMNSRGPDYLGNKHYFHIRAMLMGNSDADLYPRFLTLPFLGYVPYPGYKKKGIVQHNEDGYRGPKVPLQKTHKLRLLCIGGSTTYGFTVDSPSQSFPAQLGRLLDERVRNDSLLSQKYSGVEVINAGLDAATSAEELQQYLFKYRYYKPDMVLVHSGINDAEVTSGTADSFQLDYTHYRRINFHLEPLPQPLRWMMKSQFVSFLVIRLFYSNFSVLRSEFNHQSRQTFCKWTSVTVDEILKEKKYDYYPFYRNTLALYREIVSDSAVLIVLPNILNEENEHVKNSPHYRQLTALNNQLSDSLCRLFGGHLIPFSYDSLNRGNWLDDCHLNAAGEKEKAQFIFSYIEPLPSLNN